MIEPSNILFFKRFFLPNLIDLARSIAGHYGVPLIFVAGDQATAFETKEIHPRISIVVVKKAIGRTADTAALIPTMERINCKTVQLTTDDYISAYYGFIAAVLCVTAAAA